MKRIQLLLLSCFTVNGMDLNRVKLPLSLLSQPAAHEDREARPLSPQSRTVVQPPANREKPAPLISPREARLSPEPQRAGFLLASSREQTAPSMPSRDARPLSPESQRAVLHLASSREQTGQPEVPQSRPVPQTQSQGSALALTRVLSAPLITPHVPLREARPISPLAQPSGALPTVAQEQSVPPKSPREARPLSLESQPGVPLASSQEQLAPSKSPRAWQSARSNTSQPGLSLHRAGDQGRQVGTQRPLIVSRPAPLVGAATPQNSLPSWSSSPALLPRSPQHGTAQPPVNTLPSSTLPAMQLSLQKASSGSPRDEQVVPQDSPSSRICLSWVANGCEMTKEVSVKRDLYTHLEKLRFLTETQPFKIALEEQGLAVIKLLAEHLKLFLQEANVESVTKKMWATDLIHWTVTNKDLWYYSLEDLRKRFFVSIAKPALSLMTKDQQIKMRIPSQLVEFFPCLKKREDIHALDLGKFDSFTLSVMRELLHLIYNHLRHKGQLLWDEQMEYDEDLNAAILKLLQYYEACGSLQLTTLTSLACLWKIHPIAHGALSLFLQDGKTIDARDFTERVSPAEFEVLTRHKWHARFLLRLLRPLRDKYPNDALLDKALYSCVSSIVEAQLFLKPEYVKMAESWPALETELLAQLRSMYSVENYKNIHNGFDTASLSNAFLLKGCYLVSVQNDLLSISDLLPKEALLGSRTLDAGLLVGVAPLDEDSFIVVAKNKVTCYKVPDLTIITEFNYDADTITAFCVVSSTQILLAGRKRVIIVDLKGKLINALHANAVLTFQYENIENDDPHLPKQPIVEGVAVNGPFISAHLSDGSLWLWSVGQKCEKIVHRISPEKAKPYGPIKTALCIDGRKVVIGYANHVVGLWSIEAGALIAQLETQMENDIPLCIVPLNEKTVAIGYANGVVRTWELESFPKELSKNSSKVISPFCSKPVVHLSFSRGTLSIAFKDGEMKSLFMGEYASLQDWLQKLDVK